MKKYNYTTPILITGAERSGATIIARIIALSGAYAGKTNGMKENLGIKKLVDSYYQTFSADISGQAPLMDIEHLLLPNRWKMDVENSLSEEGWGQDKPWMYKSGRISQIWPVWNTAFPEAKYIIVRRRTGDIVHSCMKTAYMKAHTNEEAWLTWVKQHEERFNQMMTAGLNCMVIWPERMIDGDYRQVYEMLEWLRLGWHKDIVKVIDPLFNKVRRK